MDRLLPSRESLEGERKWITVLFADLKGSMELLADRDPEDAREILDPVLEHMMAAVHQFGGTVNQVMGDGIMALFGAPRAHEDHAVRACYAALEMQERVKRYATEVRRSRAAVVSIRVGLNSGEVVVRAIGSDLNMDYTAVGQTTHLASRAEQLADPGTIVITPDTLALAEDYVTVKRLGPVKVKGLAEPLELYELTGVGQIRTRLEATAVRRGLTRFVGRADELEKLRRGQELAADGLGRVTAIVGEAGVGKSRLLHEFSRSHRFEHWLVLKCACLSYGRPTSYLPVIELLKHYFKIDDRDGYRVIRERVTGKLLTLDRTLETTLPALLALLDVPVDDDTWGALDPADRRMRTLEAVKRLLLREALEQPLLVIVEDLHWIDEETQALLDGLVDAVKSTRVLLLVNYRPEYQHNWGSRSHYSETRVEPLAKPSAEELLRALLGGDTALDQLKQQLIERTKGNPFFLEESVQALVETHVLAGEPGAYRVVVEPAYSIQVPASVQALLAARIDRLPADEKRLLQAAAVVGRDVPLPLLREVAAMDEPELRRAVASLQAAEFLQEAHRLPDPEYTFKHALTHEVAYGTLLLQRRRELHAHIVQALERHSADRLPEHVERLAHHALRGEVWDKATAYLRRAGLKSAARSAYREALTFFDEAHRAIAHLPDTHDTKVQAIDLRLDSRSALAPLGQYGRILDRMREAECIARAIGDRRRLGHVLADIGARLRNVGDHAGALEASRQALDIATELEDTGLEIEAKYRLAQAYFAVGDFMRAGSLFEETAQALANDDVARRLALPRFFRAWPRAWLARTLSHLGRFGEAARHAQEAVRIAELADHPHTVIESYGALGNVGLEQGNLPNALRAFEHSLGLLRARGAGDANILSDLGYAYALSGRLSEGLLLLEESLGGEVSINAMGLGLADRVSRLAEALLLDDRLGEALERARAAVDLARKHGERADEAMALRVLADVIAARTTVPDATIAKERYEESLALAQTLGMRPLVARCHARLAELHRRAGNYSEAEARVVLARTMHSEMGMTSRATASDR